MSAGTPTCKRCGRRTCQTPWRVLPPLSWSPGTSAVMTCAEEAVVVNEQMPEWGAPKPPRGPTACAQAAAGTNNERAPLMRQGDESPELFRFLSATFDVTHAKRLVAGRSVVAIDPMTWRSYVRLPHAQTLYALHIDIDKERAQHSDLTLPILIARLTRTSYLPIDGWNRIYRAIVTGTAHLGAQILTVRETHRVRIE